MNTSVITYPNAGPPLEFYLIRRLPDIPYKDGDIVEAYFNKHHFLYGDEITPDVGAPYSLTVLGVSGSLNEWAYKLRFNEGEGYSNNFSGNFLLPGIKFFRKPCTYPV